MFICHINSIKVVSDISQMYNMIGIVIVVNNFNTKIVSQSSHGNTVQILHK